jgi:hypothetical protein
MIRGWNCIFEYALNKRWVGDCSAIVRPKGLCIDGFVHSVLGDPLVKL